MIFLAIFVMIPLIEIGLFIAVGGEIGIFPTLLLCFLTAALGAFLVRLQGLQTIMAAKNSALSLRLPMAEIFDGVCIITAGVCLMVPGFFTDAAGFALLVPAVRARLRAWLADRFEIGGPGGPDGTARYPKIDPKIDGDVIEGSYRRLDDD